MHPLKVRFAPGSSLEGTGFEPSGAIAGILSPVAFGWILDRTGSWTTPFAFSVGLLLFAIVMTWWIRPDRPIEAVPSLGRLAVAGQ